MNLRFVALSFVAAACNPTDKGTPPGSTSSPESHGAAVAAAPTAATPPNPAASAPTAPIKGQTVKWDQQGFVWTMPADWKKKDVGKETLVYGSDSAFLTVAISTLDEGFPTEVSLKALYEGAKTNLKIGKYDELNWYELDGVRGIQWREAKPEKDDDIRRLQWQAYRKHAGQTQLVMLVLSAKGAAFPTHQNELRAVLASTKLAH